MAASRPRRRRSQRGRHHQDAPPADPDRAQARDQIAGLEDVSGVGTYTAQFTLPSNWNSTNGAYLNLGGLGAGSAHVIVNDAGLIIRTGLAEHRTRWPIHSLCVHFLTVPCFLAHVRRFTFPPTMR